MPPVIALTGGIGSGKTSVANLLAGLGAAVVDTDEIAHELTAPNAAGTQAVAVEFGPGYLDANGALDRKRMRELVFSDAAAKEKLEAVLHPMIRAAVRNRINELSAHPAAEVPYIVIVVPLLVETGAYRELARRVLVVDCPEDVQIDRVVRRSGLTREAVQAIMKNQATREERLRNADDIVLNDGDLPSLRDAVQKLHQSYLTLANRRP